MITLKEAAKRYKHFTKDPDKVIKLPETKPECPHCKFIDKTFCGDHPIDSNRNYWHMTEVFVYLHDGKDYCNWGKE